MKFSASEASTEAFRSKGDSVLALRLVGLLFEPPLHKTEPSCSNSDDVSVLVLAGTNHALNGGISRQQLRFSVRVFRSLTHHLRQRKNLPPKMFLATNRRAPEPRGADAHTSSTLGEEQHFLLQKQLPPRVKKFPSVNSFGLEEQFCATEPFGCQHRHFPATSTRAPELTDCRHTILVIPVQNGRGVPVHVLPEHLLESPCELFTFVKHNCPCRTCTERNTEE